MSTFTMVSDQRARQLAKAKSEYMALCDAVELVRDIIAGRQRGSKDTWNMLEKAMFRGKQSFDGVMDIRALAKAEIGDVNEEACTAEEGDETG